MTLQPQEVLLRQVTRCRRRLRWLLFVRHASVAVSMSAVAAAVIVVLRADRANAIAWLGGALVLGVAGAACAAAWRAPGQRSTAAALDNELQLEDRVATALQFLSHDDPVAGLIVRDATARVADIVPAQVFRLDVRVTRRVLLLPAAAAVLAVALALVPEARRGAAAARSGGVSIGTGAARLVSASRDGEKHESAPQPSPLATSVAASGDKTDAVQRTSAEREGAESRPPSDTDAETAFLTEGSPEPSPEFARRPIATDRTPAEAGSGGEDSHGSGGGAATTERRVIDPGAPASRTGAGSIGGSGIAPIDPQERNGGGIRGGVGSRDFVDGQQIRRAMEPPYAAHYRAAWARVQGSFGRNNVPPSLRTYLRDYFVAIRPSERE